MKSVFLLLCTLIVTLHANVIDFSKNSETILHDSQIYIDTQNLSFDEVKEKGVFSQSPSEHINLGFVTNTTLWIELHFYNNSNESLKKILEVRNPLLESVTLFSSKKSITKGVLHTNSSHERINPAFTLSLQPKEIKHYYLRIQNRTTALRLGLYLKDETTFIHDDHTQQLLIFILFSILIMLFLYNILLFFYTKERSYLYYCLYLLTLLLQQATYLGVSQMYLPAWLIYYDNLNVVLKVNIMYITAAIFAQSFLLSSRYPRIHTVYNIIIFIAILEIPLLGTPWFYYPEIAILTGFFFVIFNILSGVYIYKEGYKEARFFVIGWSFLAIGFSLMILDGLGVISVMHKISNLILFLTAIEAMFLSLAFTDRYIILKEQKERSDLVLFNTLKERQKVIEDEIAKQTKELHTALEKEKVLLKELHHRTKNNLQLILSLVRMQSDNASKDVKEYSQNLEYRINAIARMHQMLYFKEDLQQINMDEYMNELSNDLENLSAEDVTFKIKGREIYLPFKEAGYIGLILNELITNSIKYTTTSHIVISIEINKEKNRYTLEYKDNGLCYDFFKNDRSSIGLKLVKTLVEDQLEGSIKLEMKNECNHVIEFEL